MALTFRLWAACALVCLAGCDDGGDVGAEPDLPDALAPPDASPADVEPPSSPDAAWDAAPPPHLDAPRGRVYALDPTAESGALVEVDLPMTTYDDGRLTGAWVEVYNCLNEEGGIEAETEISGLHITGRFCHEVQTVRPAADGHYLHIEPPQDPTDPNDPFAELMMYFHVTRVHDYFRDTLGFTDLDFPLPALVNVQFQTNAPATLLGFERGPGGWWTFPNALFFPQENWNDLAAQIGLPPRDSDTIIFGQAEIDFAYDATVIYHEYAHAMIGTSRLQARVADRWGLDDMPRAMNEGLADYFAASLADHPVVGFFGIGSIDAAGVRDLSEPRRCPEDVHGEVHVDGRVIGSLTWAIREALGAQLADAIVYGALEQFTTRTNLHTAAEILIAEAAARGAEDVVAAIVDEHGALDCARIKPFAFEVGDAPEQRPRIVEGRGTVGVVGFDDWAPGNEQYDVEVPELATGVELTWRAIADGPIPGIPGNLEAELDVAVRRDTPLELSYVGTDSGAVEISAEAILTAPGEREERVFVHRLTLTGDCLPAAGGHLYAMFLNRSFSAARVTSLRSRILDPFEAPTGMTTDCAR